MEAQLLEREGASDASLEPRSMLVPTGPAVILPEIRSPGTFTVTKDGPVPFSEISDDFRRLMLGMIEPVAEAVPVRAYRLVGPWTDEALIAAFMNRGVTPYLKPAHMHEYLKYAPRRPADLDAGTRAPWYLFYVTTNHSESRKRDRMARATWFEEGWSMTAGRVYYPALSGQDDSSPGADPGPWDDDEEDIFVIAPES